MNFEDIRRAEIDRASAYFGSPKRLLEIGGGSGLQAKLMAEAGIKVMSIDVPARLRGDSHFTVVDYDGVRIPARSSSFDCIFSSNVLEHVTDLPGLFAEMRRVSRPGAVAVHVMPTTTWRLWTSMTHYPYVAKRALGVHHAIPGVGEGPSAGDALKRRGLAGTIGRVLLAGPHGEYPNAPAELYYFSARRWEKVFRDNGFEVTKSIGTGLFYTGYGMTHLRPATRGMLAGVLGSATRIYVTRAR